jgi:hypothetical protein
MLVVNSRSNAIALTRGDSAVLKIALTDAEGNVYTPGANDVIRFAVKKNFKDEQVLLSINAVIDGSDITLTIPPSATKSMAFGSYKYDIQLTSGTGANQIVDTFIDKATFTITEEID